MKGISLPLAALVLISVLPACGAAPVLGASAGVAGSLVAAPLVAAPFDPPVTDRIAFHETIVIEGALDSEDARNPLGHFVDRYAVQLGGQQLIRFSLRSPDFDPTLRITLPDGTVLENDDVSWATDSLLQFWVESAGSLTVDVSSWGPGEQGRYELQVLELRPQSDQEVRDGISWGVSFRGNMVERDRAFGPSASNYLWLEAGRRFSVRVGSSDIDPVVWMLGPGGEQWFNDDANFLDENGRGSLLDAVVSGVSRTTGWHQMVASSWERQSGGLYALRIQVEPTLLVYPNEETPATGVAGARGNGRVWGLFVGISKYSADDILPGTDDDARSLAKAFGDRFLMRQSQSFLLVDEQATRENFVNALDQIAQRSSANDLVVVFFSGHGARVEATPGQALPELDGLDEVIHLYDGIYRDWELAQALDRIPAERALVAIDACEAGGFAQDIMQVPGRIGLFSSDTDVLSTTADSVNAGGYLSYLLRRAVEGEGDFKPQDGALTAGELIDFLTLGAMEVNAQMNPPGSLQPMQRFVMERGTVRWDEILWMYPRPVGE